jgi:hypothetical protein
VQINAKDLQCVEVASSHKELSQRLDKVEVSAILSCVPTKEK